MKSSFYKLGIAFLKFVVGALLIGYLYALYHVVYIDENTKQESFIDNMGNAGKLLLWVLFLLVVGGRIA